MSTIHEEALAQMRERGGSWAAYENKALDSANAGHLRFLKYGPDCTCPSPPQRYPDAGVSTSWAYLFVGTVDLKTGTITKE